MFCGQRLLGAVAGGLVGVAVSGLHALVLVSEVWPFIC